MRLDRLLGSALAALLILLAFPAAAADHGSACPDYTVEVTGDAVGEGDVGVAANEHGQLAVYADSNYVFWDYTYGVTGDEYLFSMWLYMETNGEEGPQRHDDYCHDAPRDEADIIWS